MFFLSGMIGILKIKLNVTASMLSAIMIGAGIDYTIHFLWRYKAELAAGMSHIQAVQKTLTTSGRRIVFNVLSVITGFSAAVLSNFVPIRYFGFIITVCIGISLVSALLHFASLQNRNSCKNRRLTEKKDSLLSLPLSLFLPSNRNYLYLKSLQADRLL